MKFREYSHSRYVAAKAITPENIVELAELFSAEERAGVFYRGGEPTRLYVKGQEFRIGDSITADGDLLLDYYQPTGNAIEVTP